MHEYVGVGGGATDAAMSLDFLMALKPPLLPATLDSLRTKLAEHNLSLSVLSQLKIKELGQLLGLENIAEIARIKSSIPSDPAERYAPPPLGPNGEPVIVRPKVGFTALSQVDTVNQTVHARFYLDLYWNDPRLKGLDVVPDGVWRPADCYVVNQHGTFERIRHSDNPVLIDSATGLLLWPVELVGELQNPMALHAFPFDSDVICLHVHQNETSSRDDYLLRPYADPGEERQSVRFFFGVFEDLTEFDVVGFSKECYESVGGNLVEYSQLKLTLHVVRRWQYYAWKVALPMAFCTIFCFAALFLPIDAEGSPSGRQGARVALLYVVASTLPKTAYLTTMDKYVLANMLIQFAVALLSWLSVGIFFPLSNAAANKVNLVGLWVLLAALVGSSVLILGLPMLRAVRRERIRRARPQSYWPATLKRGAEPPAAFYAFELCKNVFPPWEAGSKNPVKIDEKVYGPAVSSGAGPHELPPSAPAHALQAEQGVKASGTKPRVYPC